MKNLKFHRRMGNAWRGIRAAVRSEASLRTHVLFAAGLIPALVVLRPAPIWWALCIVMAALVIAAELMNTALEYLADHLHPDEHPMIGAAKDCAAGAVLVLSAGALAVAGLTVLSIL